MEQASTDPMADDNKNNDEDLEEEGQQEDEEYVAGDELPENHFKMSAFQITIKKVLERQIEKLNLEVKETATESLGGKLLENMYNTGVPPDVNEPIISDMMPFYKPPSAGFHIFLSNQVIVQGR